MGAFMKLATTGFLAVAAVFAATTANATTYTGVRSVGSESVSLSITTDGTLGVLGAGNIASWSVVIADPDPTRSFNNFTLTPVNSALRLLGDADQPPVRFRIDGVGQSRVLSGPDYRWSRASLLRRYQWRLHGNAPRE